MGIDLAVHDLRFEEDNWESPTLGAWGVGWQVMLDGMEITQFTYFQQAGGLELDADLVRDHLRPRAHHHVPRAVAHRSTTSTGCPAASTTARCGTRTSSSCRSTTSSSPTSTCSGQQLRRLGGRSRALPRGGARAARLRDGAQVLAPVQPARRPRRGLGDRARGADQAGARPGDGLRRRVPGEPRAARLPAARRADEREASTRGREAMAERRGELLLEVRAEEIPARMLAPASRRLADARLRGADRARPGPTEVETGFTPRRLVLIARGAAGAQRTARRRSSGRRSRSPSTLTEADRPLGFAKRCGVEPSEAARAGRAPTRASTSSPAVDPRAADPRDPGRAPAARCLTEIPWPKTMRWGAGSGPWVRPVHGVVALFAGEVVPFELFGVAAAPRPAGHPMLSPAAFDVRGRRATTGAAGGAGHRGRSRASASRRSRRRWRRRAEAAGGTLVEDPQLLAKLAAICEIPGVMEGSSTGALPRAAAGGADHQPAGPPERLHRRAPDGEADGGAAARLPDRHGPPRRPGGARARRATSGWSRRASPTRGSSSQEDRKVPLAERAGRLEHLSFHERLGSYADKTERMAALAS